MTRLHLLLVALVATIAAACGGGGGASSSSSASAPSSDTTASAASTSTEAAPAEPVEITMWHGQEGPAAKSLEQLAADFNASQTAVTVKMSSGGTTADNMLQKIEGALAGDTYPDIAYLFGSWAPNLAPSDKVADIAQLVQAPEVKWDEFPGAARESATVNGKVIGFPAAIGNLALIYNKKIFAAKGVAEPTDSWTWDDFRKASKDLTGDGTFGTAYPIDASEDTVWRFWPMMWQGGGDIVSSDLKQATFANDGATAALELLRAMAVDDKSVYLDPTNQKIDPLFHAGKIGMLITGPWVLPDLQAAKLDYGVTLLPGFGDHQTISGDDNWVVFKHDDARVQAAVTFLAWMTAPEQDLRYAIDVGGLPLRSSTPQLPGYADFTSSVPGVEMFVSNLANAEKARPPLEAYPKLSTAVGKAITSVLLGKAQPADALAKAQEQAQQALDKG